MITHSNQTAKDLFVHSVLRISAAIDGPGLETAREIFPERLAKVAKLLEILDGKWVDHRDNGGPLPSSEIADWERGWLDIARRVRSIGRRSVKC